MIEVEWTGVYPCLCAGRWVLKINGVDYSHLIPFKNTDANTYGSYATWSFGEDWEEEWDWYDDGLPYEAWVRENEEWLSKLPCAEFDMEELYKAFQEEDWRHGSCGGCI